MSQSTESVTIKELCYWFINLQQEFAASLMNAPQAAHDLSPDFRRAHNSESNKPTRRPARPQPSGFEPDVGRKHPAVSLAVVVVLLALLGILYFWSKPLPPDGTTSPSSAGTPSKAMQLALPQAPGLSSASRAFSSSSTLVPLTPPAAAADGATRVDALAPEETLLKVGKLLSPEWGLAVALLNEPEGAPAASPASEAASTLSAAATVSTETPVAAKDAPAAGTVPQVADSALSRVPVPQVAAGETPQFSREVVHPGITRRIYEAPAERPEQSLAALVAECGKQGAIAGETCRQSVCRVHWGKDPACPIQDTYVLP